MALIKVAIGRPYLEEYSLSLGDSGDNYAISYCPQNDILTIYYDYYATDSDTGIATML
jgi:hypothetical protein